MIMRCYITRCATHDALTRDLKTLVPDAALRRRMSRFVRMGVTTMMECLSERAQADAIDAIVTATGLGSLADSEKFLRNVLEQDEELLNPTPFIQSTFNTIGAHVAQLCRNYRYNMTYAHRGHSFESALLDAVLLLEEGAARHVLVGAADERTPSQHRIMERMGFWRSDEDGEGAVALLLSAEASGPCAACLTQIDFPEEELSDRQIAACYAVDRVLRNPSVRTGCYPTASARMLAEGVRTLGGAVRRVATYNTYRGDRPSVFIVECPQ